MKVKTSELKGAALDWTVANAIGAEKIEVDGRDITADIGHTKYCSCWSPSSDWEQFGPLIEKYKVWLSDDADEAEPDGPWIASIAGGEYVLGSTPLIAGCRAIVNGLLPDEIEVPNELL